MTAISQKIHTIILYYLNVNSDIVKMYLVRTRANVMKSYNTEIIQSMFFGKNEINWIKLEISNNNKLREIPNIWKLA